MIETSPLNIQIYNTLKKEIISGDLKPGETLNITELAKKWNVSSTPVRDAIHFLEQSGFVTIHPRKNVTVSRLDKKAFTDVFTLRIALECLGVELSIDRIPKGLISEAITAIGEAYDSYQKSGNPTCFHNVDHIVHRMVLDYCGNEKLVSTMNNLQELISWTRGIVILQEKAYEKAAFEHIRILECMLNGDPSAAVNAMRKHLSNSYKRNMDYWNTKENQNGNNGLC